MTLQQSASIVHLVCYARSGAQTWRIALQQRRDTAESEGQLILMVFTFPGPSRPRQTTAITQDWFSWSLSLSELLLRHGQDPPGPGVLNKRDEPQPISRSLLDGKRYFLHGTAKIDRAYLF